MPSTRPLAAPAVPRITTKALAEFASGTIHDHLKILSDQKHPDTEAARQRFGYYQATLAATRGFYRMHDGRDFLTGRKERLLKESKSASRTGAAKKRHNARAIYDFAEADVFTGRPLTIRAKKTYQQDWEGVDVTIRPDIEGITEDGSTKYILLHCADEPIEVEYGRRLLELSYQLLDDCGVVLDFSDVEIFCLKSQMIHTNSKRPRIPVMKRASKDLRAIKQMWPAA